MKRFVFSIIFILVFLTALTAQKKTSSSQNPYARIDELMQAGQDSLTSMGKVASYINRTFSSEYEKTRALFYWITENISYAPDLMYSFTTNDNRRTLAKDVFDNRTGVCIGYAVLFDTLSKLCHLNSFVVLGSTRQSFLPTIIGHAWNAVKIFDVWQLVDVTWGSGYLQGDRFIKKRNDAYFLPDPEKIVHTHLPLDPIWQLLKHPVTLYQFHSKLKSTISTDWNYTDSISAYLQSDDITKIKGARRRLTEFGNNSEVTSNYTNYLKSKEFEYYNSRLSMGLKSYNLGVEEFNEYVEFKNHQFTPTRTDDEIRKMLPSIYAKLDGSEQYFNLIISQITDANYIEEIRSTLKQSKDLRLRVDEEKKFVDKYLSTKKNKRRDLFYTKIYTINGVPVNK